METEWIKEDRCKDCYLLNTKKFKHYQSIGLCPVYKKERKSVIEKCISEKSK